MDGVHGIENAKDYILLQLNAFLAATNFPTDNPDFFFIKDVGAEPNHVFETFLHAFPEGNIISIKRNPKFTVRAIILDRKKHNRTLTFFGKLRYIYEAYRTHRQQVGYADHPRVLTISMEELEQNGTKHVMQKVLGFCNLKFPPNPVNGFPVVFRSSDNSTGFISGEPSA